MMSSSQSLHRASSESFRPQTLRHGSKEQECLSGQNRRFPAFQKRPLPPPSLSRSICNTLICSRDNSLTSRGSTFRPNNDIFLSQGKIEDLRRSPVSPVNPVGPPGVRCRASSTPKTVPEQHLAQVVAEETTDNVRYRHLIRSKSHIIQGDLGLEYGGTDFGPSPKEMVLSGLAMETSLTMRMYADRKNWPLRRIRVVVKEHGRGKGQLPDGLDVVVHFDGELSREQKAALLEVAGKSPVKNMLLGKMTKGISTRIAIKQKARPGPVPELTGGS
ncbi:hypothetical protein KFL_000180350 [Klebsormidium nitens]|uniref:Uncharacterized protein n=1 Tax=Klebsormidium nitens TaxID=105231 RepID=A0A1Y1HM46_KLENI|nr:hypothetical protein KFL_000180350 [Klebsormidium nitens]|eukprot:GAQ78752.1 hypothetical protein KFL_000180350 [Klebsormidium nitens]